MDFLQDFFTQLTRLRWSDYLDIILVGFLLYRLLPMLRSSGAVRIAKIVGLVLALTWITGELHLNTLNFLLEQVLAVGLIAVVVLFQPELRRMVDRLSSVRLKTFLGIQTPGEDVDPLISQTVQEDKMTVCLNPIQGKVDLFACPYLERLKDASERNRGDSK